MLKISMDTERYGAYANYKEHAPLEEANMNGINDGIDLSENQYAYASVNITSRRNL